MTLSNKEINMIRTADDQQVEEADVPEVLAQPWSLLKLNNHNKDTFSKNKEILVEVKVRARNGKCVGAPVALCHKTKLPTVPETAPHTYTSISDCIWYCVASYVLPEEVQTFALVCRQTAKLVQTRGFWLSLYARYCGVGWNALLPDVLQYDNMRGYDFQTLRAEVIKALFRCYPPLSDRIIRGYSLDMLVNRSYLASWQTRSQGVWINCYTFWNRYTDRNRIQATQENVQENMSDWETSVEENVQALSTLRIGSNVHEGVSLLVIFCDRFIPSSTHLLYVEQSKQAPRLKAARRLLSTDMRAYNLCLDFADANKAITTIQYPHVTKLRVLPWWHHDFHTFNK